MTSKEAFAFAIFVQERLDTHTDPKMIRMGEKKVQEWLDEAARLEKEEK